MELTVSRASISQMRYLTAVAPALTAGAASLYSYKISDDGFRIFTSCPITSFPADNGDHVPNRSGTAAEPCGHAAPKPLRDFLLNEACFLARLSYDLPERLHSPDHPLVASANASAIVFSGKISFSGSSSSRNAPNRSYQTAARSSLASIARAMPPTSTATESALLPAASRSSPPSPLPWADRSTASRPSRNTGTS